MSSSVAEELEKNVLLDICTRGGSRIEPAPHATHCPPDTRSSAEHVQPVFSPSGESPAGLVDVPGHGAHKWFETK